MKAGLVTAASLALGVNQACAQGLYVGGSVGQTSVEINEFSAPGVTTASKEDSDTWAKFFAGFSMNRNFALELGYLDLGQYTLTLRSGSATNIMTFATNALYLDAVGRLEVTSKLAFLARAGVAHTSFKIDEDDNGIFCTCTTHSRRSRSNLKYGLGAEYSFNQAFRVRGEYEVVTDVADGHAFGESEISLLSIGLIYRF